MASKARVKVHTIDHGWIAFFKRVYEISKAGKVKVGFLDEGLSGQIHDSESGLTVAQIASILEFGTEDGHIPARSVVRATFDEKREEMVELAKELIDQILDGRMDVNRALGLMGAKLAAEMKKKITAGEHVQPENAPSTIAAKGSDRPWVDTGRTVGAITWSVEGEEHGGGKKGGEGGGE